MQKFNKFLPIALFLGFLFAGIALFIQAKPSHKNARVYKIVRKYSPYYLEKTIGGLNIKKKGDKKFKESPDNAKLFKRFEFLEKEWGKKHLKLIGTTLEIFDNNNSIVKKIELKNKNEINFAKKYYGVK